MFDDFLKWSETMFRTSLVHSWIACIVWMVGMLLALATFFFLLWLLGTWFMVMFVFLGITFALAIMMRSV